MGQEERRQKDLNVSLLVTDECTMIVYMMWVCMCVLRMELQLSQPWLPRERDKGWGPGTKEDRGIGKIESESKRVHFLGYPPHTPILLFPISEGKKEYLHLCFLFLLQRSVICRKLCLIG